MPAVTFERHGAGAAPLEGPGTLEVTPAGLRLTGRAIRTTTVMLLSGVVALVVVAIVVTTMLEVLDALDLVDRSLRKVVTLGVPSLVGAFLGARALLSRWLPLRSVEHVIPFSYLVSASTQNGRLELVCTDPDYLGRISARSTDSQAIAQAILQAKSR
jgi:hypothetical protein